MMIIKSYDQIIRTVAVQNRVFPCTNGPVQGIAALLMTSALGISNRDIPVVSCTKFSYAYIYLYTYLLNDMSAASW